MILIINIFQIIIICLALSSLAEFVGDLIHVASQDVTQNYIKLPLLLISYILSCGKCFSFWFTLIYTQDLFVAAAVSLLTTLILLYHNKTLKY